MNFCIIFSGLKPFLMITLSWFFMFWRIPLLVCTCWLLKDRFCIFLSGLKPSLMLTLSLWQKSYSRNIFKYVYSLCFSCQGLQLIVFLLLKKSNFSVAEFWSKLELVIDLFSEGTKQACFFIFYYYYYFGLKSVNFISI